MPASVPPMSVHIDSLSISQDHADCPVWGSTRRLECDLETGAVQWEVVRGDQVQGSWDTGLHVRSTGSRVEVSGNPSKWGRLDALVGLATMQECIAVYNSVLDQLGLPRFSLNSLVHTIGLHGGERMRQGPIISAVHVTRNLICGGTGARPFLDWMEGQHLGRLSYVRKGATTVQAGTLARRQHQLYLKGPEILAHASKWRRARSADKQEHKDEASAYLQRLADWCEQNGVVRDEVKLGRKYLQESEFRFPENWTNNTASALHTENSKVDTMNAGAMSNYGVEVKQRLVDAGIPERQASMMRNAVSGWLAGQPWDDGLSERTRYRYQKALREHCGLDLRKPSNVRCLAACVKPKVLEARELNFSDLPDWYRWPERQEAA